MVWTAVIGFLGSSLLGSGTDEPTQFNKWVQTALLFLAIALVALILLMSINAYCYFSTSCSNWVDVLIPEWFRDYFGIGVENNTQPPDRTLIGRFIASGGAGVAVWAIQRYIENRRA